MFQSLLNHNTVKDDPKKAVDATLEFVRTVVVGHLLGDHVYNYARVLCHFGTLVLEFTDAWSKGDGECIYCCWWLFLPHFLGCKPCEVFTWGIAVTIPGKVSPVTSAGSPDQILWDKFVNTRGGLGHNIPCDLYNEHVNKLLKHIIRAWPDTHDMAYHLSQPLRLKQQLLGRAVTAPQAEVALARETLHLQSESDVYRGKTQHTYDVIVIAACITVSQGRHNIWCHCYCCMYH